MQWDILVGSELMSVPRCLVCREVWHCAESPSLCAAAPWQLWDLRTELDQSQAGRLSARRDRGPASLQRRTTATGGSRRWWVDAETETETEGKLLSRCNVIYYWNIINNMLYYSVTAKRNILLYRVIRIQSCMALWEHFDDRMNIKLTSHQLNTH